MSVLHPTRARPLARGLGYVAKNDPLDAEALARIGALLAPAPTPASPAGVPVLAALVTRRDQLAELLRREKQHRETTTEKVLLRDLAQNLAALQKRLERSKPSLKSTSTPSPPPPPKPPVCKRLPASASARPSTDPR